MWLKSLTDREESKGQSCEPTKVVLPLFVLMLAKVVLRPPCRPSITIRGIQRRRIDGQQFRSFSLNPVPILGERIMEIGNAMTHVPLPDFIGPYAAGIILSTILIRTAVTLPVFYWVGHLCRNGGLHGSWELKCQNIFRFEAALRAIATKLCPRLLLGESLLHDPSLQKLKINRIRKSISMRSSRPQ